MPTYLNKTTINTLGVILATVGACLLWYFVAEVTSVNRKEILAGGEVALTIPSATPELRRRLRVQMWLSKLGAFLTVVGGALQVGSNHLPDQTA